MNRLDFVSSQVVYKCFHCKREVKKEMAIAICWTNEAGDSRVFHAHQGDCADQVNGFMGSA